MPASVRVPAGARQLRVNRKLGQLALSADESALRTIARAASFAAAGAVPTPHDFCADFIVRAVQAAAECEPWQALQVIYPDLNTSSIPFRPVSWSQCTERISACLTLQPDVWGDAVEAPARDAARALAQNALDLVEQWLVMDGAECYDCEHADVPGYDVFWSFAYMVEVPTRRLFLWLSVAWPAISRDRAPAAAAQAGCQSSTL